MLDKNNNFRLRLFSRRDGMKCLMLAWLLGFSGLVSSAVAEDATRRGGEVGASNSSGLAAVVVKLSREKAEVLEKIAKLKLSIK